MDGAVGFTQCPVTPGTSFTYNFTIGADEYGTFWWHSHSDVQRADGLWGGLVVHSPDEVDCWAGMPMRVVEGMNPSQIRC
ncbi:hypothetical protein LB505_005856 [Fusarium chuoi]|nr:hypothetical protein LB505_005856 [Fusarium chuoi]